MLESLYVRDLNMCSLFVVVIAVSSLAKNGLRRYKIGNQLSQSGQGWFSWEREPRTKAGWFRTGCYRGTGPDGPGLENEKSRTDLEKDQVEF